MDGWLKVKSAAKYADVSERTVRSWLKAGLRHCRLKSKNPEKRPGTVLIKPEWIDGYLLQFESQENEVEQIVDEVFASLITGE